MSNREFDIVRELMDGPWVEPPAEPGTLQQLRPASFREIDGRVLASQYVAHRKLAEAAARSQFLNAPRPASGEDERPAIAPQAGAADAPARNGRLAIWARRFLGS